MSAHTNWHMAAWRMAMAIGAIPILLFEPHLAAADLRQENAFLEAARSAAEKDDLQSLQAMESEALALPDLNAQRMGDRLALDLRNGDTKVFVDKPECKLPEVESRCEKYRLIVHAGTREFFVIAKLKYESVEYLVVDDAAGKESTLQKPPDFLPLGRTGCRPSNE